MRQILLITTVLLSLFMFSCKTNSLSGVYVCDQSTKKEDSTIHHKNYSGLTNKLQPIANPGCGSGWTNNFEL
jgi:hypothetical protein